MLRCIKLLGYALNGWVYQVRDCDANDAIVFCPLVWLQARDIMTEKPGVATRVMYHLFVALNRKKVRLDEILSYPIFV